MRKRITLINPGNDLPMTCSRDSDDNIHIDEQSVSYLPKNVGNLFVTVGTTEFEQLIIKLNTAEIAIILFEHGCSRLVIQIGHGETEPNIIVEKLRELGVEAEWYRFKDTLHHDMKSSSVIISHAGAGSIMEGLAMKKFMIVVINESLMDNHQTELADELARRNHIIATNCEGICHDLKGLDLSKKLLPYPEPNLDLFPQYLNHVIGVV